jgi:Na+/proline symporter
MLFGIVAYLIVLVLIGAVASRRMKDVRDYFAAGKRLGYWAVAFSARATGESAWLLLGLTGMGAVFGVQAFWIAIGELLGVSGAWLLMSRRFKNLTDRYDRVGRPSPSSLHCWLTRAPPRAQSICSEGESWT